MTDEVILELSDKLGMAASDVSNHLFELVPQWATMKIIESGTILTLALISFIIIAIILFRVWKSFQSHQVEKMKARQEADEEKLDLRLQAIKERAYYRAEDAVNRDITLLICLGLVEIGFSSVLGIQVINLLTYIFVPEPAFWQTIISALK